MAKALLSPFLSLSLRDIRAANASPSSVAPWFSLSKNIVRIATSFSRGSPLFWRSSCRKKHAYKATSVSIRCEQRTNDSSGLYVWLGRSAMVGFAVAIAVEIATGKGLLENFGLTTPLPTAALVVTALVGVLTAIFIFQSDSEN